MSFSRMRPRSPSEEAERSAWERDGRIRWLAKRQVTKLDQTGSAETLQEVTAALHDLDEATFNQRYKEERQAFDLEQAAVRKAEKAQQYLETCAYWARQLRWSMREAAFLLLEIDPRNSHRLEKRSALYKEYDGLLNLLQTSYRDGDLPGRSGGPESLPLINVRDLFDWAARRQVPIPPELAAAVEQFGGPDLRDQEIIRLRAEVARLSEERSPRPAYPDRKPNEDVGEADHLRETPASDEALKATPARKEDPNTEAERTRRIQYVVRAAQRLSNLSSLTNDAAAQELLGSKQNHGLSLDTLRRIMGGTYKPMKKLGIAGPRERSQDDRDVL